MSESPERLWVCHICQMVGTQIEARSHFIARGHEVEMLPQEASDDVLALRMKKAA